MRGATLKWFMAAVLAALIAGCSPSGGEGNARGVNPPADDDVNLDVWLERLEVGSRELYSARDNVVAALRLKEGDIVADIGAGTGLYTLMFAEAVGAEGRVFAEDIEPLFLDLINRRAEDAGLHNITPVFGREDDVSLPAGMIDLIFIADTYHYFDNREAVMKSVYRALKPGGALVIIDYEIEPGGVRPADKSHVRFGRAGVVSEIEFIGFELAETPEVDGLDENYLVRFSKPE